MVQAKELVDSLYICYITDLIKRLLVQNSLIALGPKIWNGLSNDMKTAQKNIHMCKRLIKQWDGVECNCNVHQFDKHNFDQNK